MNKSRLTIFPQSTPWRLRDAVWLGLPLVIGTLFAGRALSFQFHEEGLRQLWLAINQPARQLWDASAMAPLATYFHRLHYLALGVDPHHHYVILSIWWLATISLLYCWARRRSSPLTGAIAGLYFLSLPAASSALFSTESLPIIAGAVLQLVLILVYREFVSRLSLRLVCVAILLFTLAASIKPLTLVLFPAVCVAIAMTTNDSKSVSAWSFAGVILVLAIGYALGVHAIRESLVVPQAFLPDQIQWFELWAYHASNLWPGWIAKWLGFLLITYLLLRVGEVGLWGLGLFVPIAGVVYFASRYYHLSPKEAYAIALMLYINWLWLTPSRRLIAPGLVWLAIAFWTIPLRIEASAVALDTAVALAFVVGGIASPIVLMGWAALRSRKQIVRNSLTVLFSLALPVVLILAIDLNHERHTDLTRTEWSNRHLPLALLIERVKQDLYAYSSFPVYADLGDFRSIETAVAVSLSDDPHHEFFEGARPANTYRLEAVMGVPYALSPKAGALNLWVTPLASPPSISEDPYFSPERWIEHIVSLCDSTQGWTPNGPMVMIRDTGGGEIGEHAIRFRSPEPFEPLAFRFESDLRRTLLMGSTDFVVTFWIRTDRWDALEGLRARIRAHDESWRWGEVLPNDTFMRGGWRRVKLEADAASAIRTPEALSRRIVMEWWFEPSASFGQEPMEIELDDIRLWKRR